MNRQRIFGVVILALFIVFPGLQNTNAGFVDAEKNGPQSFTAGTWIPTLAMSEAPPSPNGDNGFYDTNPCITLTASGLTVGSADIYYEFSDDGDPVSGGSLYTGACVPVPEGNPVHFQAIAVNTLNPTAWKSNIVSETFKVDTTCPLAALTAPLDGATVSGSVPIRGTVTDANPHHYWLSVQTLGGTQIAGPGTVNASSSFTDSLLSTWNTASLSSGTYRIKLEARDAAGNKCPDLAPVPNDPEVGGDSVDWIEVTIDNDEPVISGVEVLLATPGDANAPQATIKWLTDENATSNIEWGETPGYGDEAPDPLDTTADTLSHEEVIGGLDDNQEYHFRIRSEDGAGNVAHSGDFEFQTGNTRLGLTGWIPGLPPVVINEFLPNPNGSDDAGMPGGEWVELYNKTGSPIDVNGWMLTDSNINHRLYISSTNTDTGSTIIPANGYLVVYRDGDSDFSLNNDEDSVQLYAPVQILWFTTWVQVDFHVYHPAFGDVVIEGKSFARFPDGGPVWIDPETTPGDENELTPEELAMFRGYTLEKCFDAEGDLKESDDKYCDPSFLVYLGMLEDEDSDTLALPELLKPDEEDEAAPADDESDESEKQAAPQTAEDAPAADDDSQGDTQESEEMGTENEEGDTGTDPEEVSPDEVQTDSAGTEEVSEGASEEDDEGKTEEDEMKAKKDEGASDEPAEESTTQ